jgi:peptidoglycan biosynthesis protein MviN/MurJ (putative lipid II flippase)
VNKLRDVLRHLPASAVLAVTVLLVTAAPVLAHDNGEGWYGETNDRVVTNAGFVLIIFFPLFVFLVSLLQWQLEKRKDRRKAEAKRRAQASGGWLRSEVHLKTAV